LFSLQEHDLKKQMREGANDADLVDWLQAVVLRKESGHRIGQAQFQQPDRTMSAIGG
jgi:cyclic pyranopterin phosphate synthase